MKKLMFVLLITLLLSSASLAAGPERLWVAAFTYDVPSDTWAEGDHSNRFEFTWTEPTPDSYDGATGEFTVSDEAPMYPGFVLLRGSFYKLARVPGADSQRCVPIGEIHPDQPTRFHIGWRTDEPMTYQEARAHFESMTATVVWDDSSSAQLVRHEIKPATESWSMNVCSWTVRQ